MAHVALKISPMRSGNIESTFVDAGDDLFAISLRIGGNSRTSAEGSSANGYMIFVS